MTNYGPIHLSPHAVYYHITHWKAGSQWFLAILKAAFRSAVLEPADDWKHLASPQPGKIHPCCYLSRRNYVELNLPQDARRILIIRDLRDTLISGYFSVRNSHDVNEAISKQRELLKSCSMEEGLIHLMDQWLPSSANIQRSWVYHGEPAARLEDFMSQPAEALQTVLSRGWGVQLTSRQARELIKHHSFERYSGGRRPGQEDPFSHYRKGVHGDWRTYFTPRVVDEFKKRYHDLLLKSGYETSADW